jgi:hypothetical protein
MAVPDLTIDNEAFTAHGARLAVSVPVSSTETVAKMVMDLTSGRVTVPLPE